MLLIKTVTGQIVNADTVHKFTVDYDNKNDRYTIKVKPESCAIVTDLGYYWSPETACEELNKLSEFLSKRNNGVYVLTDITRKEEK